MSRTTPYAKEIARADFAGCRIERIFVKETLRQVVRFSDWRGGRYHSRALEIGEDELLVLMGDAIAARVFSHEFLSALSYVLRAQTSEIQQ